MTNKFTRILFLACFALALLSPAPATAQVAMVSTTTTAAVSLTDSRVQLTSVTGVLAASGVNVVANILIDREEMDVLSVAGLVATVRRGVNGTGVGSHVSGAAVWVGPPSAFANSDPSGSCTSNQQPYAPRVVPSTGNLWSCGNGLWTTFGSYTSRLTLGAAIASATTIAPTNPMFHVTGTTNVVNITVPPACPVTGCQIVIIPDGIFATTNAGNIALASTAVVSKALIMTYSPVDSKWYPSY